MTATDRQLLQGYLTTARFEVLPLRGVLEQVRDLPAGSTVTVTSSPAKGTGATLDLATRLSAAGLHVVPHLAARLITDRGQLSDVLDRIEDLGISEVFVIAGDSPVPAGQFADALDLLRAMEELGKKPARIGITGYPERHALIPDEVTVRAMREKSRYADYIVSQICFDADVTAAWVRAVRDRGITLPIRIGAPGAVHPAKLLRISMKIGLGESMRFVRKQHGVVTNLLTRYTPDDLFDRLTPLLLDPEYGVAGWHLFTFNEVVKTHQWTREMADRIQEVSA